MANIIFINSKPEAQIAADVANTFYADEFKAEEFYKRYTHNVVNYLPNCTGKHRMLAAIAKAIDTKRARNRANRQANVRTEADTRIKGIQKKKDYVADAARRAGVPETFINWNNYDWEFLNTSLNGIVADICADYKESRG